MEKKYNTQQIVAIIADLLNQSELEVANQSDFDNWILSYRAIEDSFLKEKLPESTLGNYPFKDEVLKLVYRDMFGYMPFSKDYVLKNYETKSPSGIEYLLFPAKQAKRMIILFSGLSGHKTYNRYSWYWDPKEEWDGDTVYLFLNDVSARWYVGNEGTGSKQEYSAIINSVIKTYGINRNNIYTVGGSMGGYGAMLFASELGLGGVICVHPQLNYKGTLRQRTSDWAPKIKECGSNFVDAEDFIYRAEKVPKIYLEYGQYEADRYCSETFLDALRRLSHFVVIKHTDNKDHVTASPDKNTIDSVLTFFEQMGDK